MQTSYGCIFQKKTSVQCVVAAMNITLGVPGCRADKYDVVHSRRMPLSSTGTGLVGCALAILGFGSQVTHNVATLFRPPHNTFEHVHREGLEKRGSFNAPDTTLSHRASS
jgi:hypothetical protein